MRCALSAVAFVAVLVVPPLSVLAQPVETPWGVANKTFCTRLLSDKGAYEIDEPIRVRLEVRNESDAEQPFCPPDLVWEHSLVIRREGEPVRYIAGGFQTAMGATRLKPGEVGRTEEVRLNEYWDLRQPGRYTVQFPETGMMEAFVGPFTEADIRALRRVFPASNVLTIEVRAPADGKLPPLDLASRVHLFTRPAGKEVPPWRGIATNISWFELGGDAENAGSVFAFVPPDLVWPVYEDREVYVLLRAPECRQGDQLTIRSAELNGSAIRVQLGLQPAADGGPRVLPYALLGLDRRLPPGDYTCDVRLVTERKGAAEPQVDGYRFGFTVLAARAAP